MIWRARPRGPPADTARSHAQPCWLGSNCAAAQHVGRAVGRQSDCGAWRRGAGHVLGTVTTSLPESILPLLTCMYMYRNIYTSTHVYVDVNAYIYMYTYMYICMCIYMYTFTHKNMRMLPHVCRNTSHMYSNKPKYVCWCWTAKNESAGGGSPADTARSHAQPCWLEIQLRARAACGARCWSEI